MPAPAQPAIDALEASLKTLEGELAASKAEKVALEQQVADGTLTDAQATKMKALQDMAAGLGK